MAQNGVFAAYAPRYIKPQGARSAWPVFPLGSSGEWRKRPAISKKQGGHGCLDATTDPATVAGWCSRFPRGNIGLLCGPASGVLAIDIDIHPEQGKRGDLSVSALEQYLGPLPETLVNLTGSGGRQLLFKYPNGHEISNSTGDVNRAGDGCGVASGVDIRSTGGYIVLPPSVHPNGRAYAWSSSPARTELAELPENWVAFLESGSTLEQLSGADMGDRHRGSRSSSGSHDPMAEPFELPEVIPEGAREVTLFKYAASMRAKGIPASVILERLQQANDDRTDGSPLPENELLHAFDSAMTYNYTAYGEQLAEQSSDPAGDFEEETTDFQATAEGVYKRLQSIRPHERAEYKGLTDIALSDLFMQIFGDILRYNATAKGYMYYDGSRWALDVGDMNAERAAKLFAKGLLVYALDTQDSDFTKRAFRLQDRKARTTLLSDAKDRRFVLATDFDRDALLFNCRNGYIDLRDGSFHEHDSGLLMSRISNVVYDPAASCAEWEEKLLDMMEGDAAMVQYLREVFADALSGSNRRDQLVFLYGPRTRNGKSTTIGTIQHLFGEYALSAQPETVAVKKFANSGGPSEDLARLYGARLVHMPEPKAGMQLDVGTVKGLTGGDIQTARFLHQGTFQFRPDFAMFMNCNSLPVVNDSTLFSSDRAKVIPFNRKYSEEEQDRNLGARLRSESSISGIFNWLLEGRKATRDRGGLLREPEPVREASRQYETDSDKLMLFFSECLIADPAASTTAKDAYSIYSLWCSHYHYFAEGKSRFLNSLKAKNLLSPHGWIDGKAFHNVIKGYSLNTNFSAADVPDNDF